MTEKEKDKNRYARFLAHVSGVASSYLDHKKCRVHIPAETLLEIVGILHGWKNSNDLLHKYSALRKAAIDRALPPICVSWDGYFPGLWAWVKDGQETPLVHLCSEDGKWKEEIPVAPDSPVKRTINGQVYWRIRLSTLKDIPYGYYDLILNPGARDERRSLLISAPARLTHDKKCWGLFAPLYALHGQETQNLGGYAELYKAASFIRENGGAFIGTLPLLPVFYEGQDMDPSPYAPVSRLFSNEIFLDLKDLPGNDGVRDPGGAGIVDKINYQDAYSAKKKIILEAALHYFEKYPEGDEDYQEFLKSSPELPAYAEFRASQSSAAEQEDMRKFHLYAQYACHRQLSKFRAGETASLYLDYPVGVHRNGFDMKEYAYLFVKRLSVGAPPDLFFSNGQNWGFSPIHPQALEKDRFQYFRATLHHYFKYARMLRLDHVMGLYRLYCIPEGKEASQGAYVHYPLNGFMAVLCLEAWRHQAVLVGENLGAVPEAVANAMERHGIGRMWIAQFEMRPDPVETFDSIKEDMIASFNTHDMFPFSAFMKGADIQGLQEIELLNEESAQDLQKSRTDIIKGWGKLDPFPYIVRHMASSAAAYVMIALEDIWEEEKPQNIPGTSKGNWQKLFRLPIEEWQTHPKVDEVIRTLNRYRDHSS
ncbi:MAG: 4-alpha-glucanotransferase [Micavibrio sp.]|nr:4-alpha-glucanotransferase [Micavibrio sp.]